MAITEINAPIEEFDDSMIPDGYSADDLLEGVTEGGDGGETEEAEAEEETVPTSDGESEADDSADNSGDTDNSDDEKPEEKPEEPRRLKFKAKVNHEEVDAEIGEDELPAIYQKAQNHDKMQRRVSEYEASNKKWESIAKLLGYDSADSMAKSVPENYKRSEIQKLIDQGVVEDVAQEVVESRMSRNFGNQNEGKETSEPSSDSTGTGRNFSEELEELVQLHPEMSGKQLPQTVVEDIVHNNKRVVVAYQDYLTKINAAELQKTKKENKILKQNAAATAKAPVKGAGAGADISHYSKTEQALLKAFDDDD